MDKDNGLSSAPCSSSSLCITWLPNRQDLWSPSTVKNAIMMNFRANYNYYTYALNFTRVAAWVLKFVCSAESAATNASPSIWLDCLLRSSSSSPSSSSFSSLSSINANIDNNWRVEVNENPLFSLLFLLFPIFTLGSIQEAPHLYLSYRYCPATNFRVHCQSTQNFSVKLIGKRTNNQGMSVPENNTTTSSASWDLDTLRKAFLWEPAVRFL